MKWLVISVCLVVASSGAEEGTWFTKSLDNFSPEKCSPLDKSQIIGGFYTCLNGAGKSESGQQPQQSSWGSFGTGSLKSGSFSFDNFKKNPGSDKKAKGPADGSQKKVAGDSRETSDWPLSMNKSLSAIIACMPKLMEKKCLTPTEVDFFQNFQKIFEIQKNISSEHGKNVAKELAKTQCTKKKNVDVNTQCFSRISSQYQWFGWKMNWKDGKICKFVSQLGACEAAAYGACPVTVASFVPMLWNKSLAETPCANMNLSSSSGGDVMTGYLGYSNYFNSKSDVSGYWGGFDSKLPNQNSENRAPISMQGSIRRKSSGSNDAEEGKGTRYNFFDRETNESQEDESQEDYRAMSHHHHRRRDQVHGKQGQFNQESKYYRRYNQVRRNQEDSNDSNERDDSNEKDQNDQNGEISHGHRQNHHQQGQQNEEDFWKQRRGNREDFQRQGNHNERSPRRRNHQQEEQRDSWGHNQEYDYDHQNQDNDRNNGDRQRQSPNQEQSEDFWRRRRPQRRREEEDENQRENREQEMEKRREMMERLRERRREMERRREEEADRRREEFNRRREEANRRREEAERERERRLERARQQREQEAREKAQNRDPIDDQNDQDDHAKLQQCLRMLNTLPFSYSVTPRFEPFRSTHFRNWPNYN